MAREKWYKGGLAFECQGCGNCCSGPDEGYIWANSKEIAATAEFLGISKEQVKSKYMYREGMRYSFNEKAPSNDCIFLKAFGSGKGCEIYSVRPMQCRTWPFWKDNLNSQQAWKRASVDCPGIDKGSWYTFQQIESIRRGDLSQVNKAVSIDKAAMDWIGANYDNKACLEQLDELYSALDEHIAGASPACDSCGKCCDFADYGHRLYVTTLEMLYFWKNLRSGSNDVSIEELHNCKGKCPYQSEKGCITHKFRPTGCRIFYCSNLPTEFQNELSEKVITRLRRLHEQFGAVYYYCDLLNWFRRAALRNIPEKYCLQCRWR